MAQYDLGYYDTIAGLSALECSHKVHLSHGQLQELCTKDINARNNTDNLNEVTDEKDKKEKRRAPVHGYLSKNEANMAADSGYELQHTLLGGHVPRATLEALSSTDFAHYFHKVVDFNKAIQVYNNFAIQNSAVSSSSASTPVLSTTPTTPIVTNDASLPDVNKRPRPQQHDGVKKVILCKLCKARFSGPRRFTNMKKHMCMRG